MATIINADTSNGLKLTSDTSGIIELQSGGTTKAIVSQSRSVHVNAAPAPPVVVVTTV